MKQNLIKLAQAILLIVVMVFSSCEDEELAAGNSVTSISVAKSWFEDYKAKIEFDPQFSDLNYHWELAFETTLEDSSKAIVIPLTEKHPNIEYKGKKSLYLYPFKLNYDALVQELIPQNRKIKKKEVLENLEVFSGYILTWDLEKGFIKGAKFENNIAIYALKKKEKGHSITMKEAPIIDLDEVIVASGSGTSASIGSRSFSIGGLFGNGNGGGSGSSSGTYINPPHGERDSVSNASNDAPPSCESFNFKNKIGSLWQESAVKNIHFNIVVISPNGYHFSQIINYPNAILFGAPTNLSVGNTDISAGLAATLSAKAVETSMSETVSMYGNKPVSELTVRLYFEDRLKHNYPLYIPGGRVNFNASGFSGTPTDYKTNMFGTGNCN